MSKLTDVQDFVASVSIRETIHEGQRVVVVMQGRKAVLSYMQVNPTTIKSFKGSILNRGGQLKSQHGTSWSKTPQDVMDSAQYGVTQFIARQIQDFSAGYTKAL